MFEDLGSNTVLEINARWEKIEIANVYDALEIMGYPSQCLDIYTLITVWFLVFNHFKHLSALNTFLMC